jgi:hypothetical protein
MGLNGYGFAERSDARAGTGTGIRGVGTRTGEQRRVADFRESVP